MSISQKIRDKLLVEVQHRCTICHEKCFEIHHIIEQAEGGSDEEDNLIVMCPNCHQHRYHRSKEFSRSQLIEYKKGLIERNEVEKRLLQNLEDIRNDISNKSSQEINENLVEALNDAKDIINPDKSPRIAKSVSQMAKDMAEGSILPASARKAIEIKYEAERARVKASVDQHHLVGVDEAAYRKSNKFGRAYEFVLILDSNPSLDWKKIFMYNYSNSFYSMKRKTTIRGDRIVLIIADSDNLQAHTDWIKRLVNETNTWLTTQGFQNIDREINMQMREELERFDAIESMKARTKGIKI